MSNQKSLSKGGLTAQEKKKIAMQKLQSLQKTAVKLIKQLTISEKSKKPTQQSKIRNLSDINLILIEIQKINPLQNQIFADEKLIVFVRHFLIENSNNNKIPPLQFFRIIFVSQSVADKYLTHCIPLFISRVIQRDQIGKMKQSSGLNYQQQMFQALKLIRHWIDKFPKKFPQYLAFSLIALAELPVATSIEQRKKDQIAQHIKLFIIDILLIMSSKNTKLCCICGGFNILINSITDPVFHQKSYDIISKLLIFINDPKNRQIVSNYIDFKRVFHVLTDLDNVFLEEGYKSRNNLQMLSKFQSRLGLAKNAIVTLLKSWIGIVYIGNDPTALNSLLQTLKQVPKKYDSQLRNLIFEALEQIISVGDNIITASTAQQKNVFKISNLIGCYLMTVIELLIEQNLLRILIQLSGLEQSLVSQPSQRLLKRLTFLIFNYRPESSKYIDFLITAANKSNLNSNQMLKTSSSFVINKIGNYIYDRKQKKNHPMFNQLQNLFSLKTIFVPYSRASLNSISKTLNFISYREQENYRKDLLQKEPISKENKQNYLKWKWNIIENLLEFPDPDKYKSSNNQKYRQNKMYKYLLRFYSPSRGSFCKLDWKMNNFMYIKIGMLIVRNTITIQQNLGLVKNPPQSQFQCTVSFIGDLQKLLQINISQCLKDSNLWNITLCTKLQRQLLGFIGLFSQTKKGYQQLICQNRFIELLSQCITRPQCSHLVYLILMNLDYYREDLYKISLKNPNGSISMAFINASSTIPSSLQPNIESTVKVGTRYLLQKCIKQGSKALKLGCVQIIKILLTAQVNLFTIFSYQLLIHILKSQPQGQEIIQVVVQYLQQNLANKNNVQLFLKVLSQIIGDTDLKLHRNANILQKTISMNNSASKQMNQQKGNINNSVRNQQQNDNQQTFNKNISFYLGQSSKSFANTQKFPFEDIKSKLTNTILIRLLSNDAGIMLAQKYYPDWLNQQFEKWMSPDHNYCATLENKLNGALNFAKKKQKGFYKITNNSQVYDLLFIYKLPWLIHANERQFPLWIRQRGQSYQFFVDFSSSQSPGQKSSENQFLISGDSLKIMLGIGTMLLDQQFNIITPQNVAPLTIFLTMNSKKITLYGQKMMMVQSNGVQVYFRKYQSGFDKNILKDKKMQMSEQQQWQYYSNHVQDLNKLQILRIIINVKLPTMEHTQQLPLHLINELTKTKKGREFIEQKKYIQRAGSLIKNFVENRSPIPSPLQVRCTLFSLGFYGSRNEGIKVLKNKKIFDDILKLTFNSPILSLRGTCRYILNMLSHSQYGRNLLLQNGFHVNSRCFTCYPMDNKKFYSIVPSTPLNKSYILDQSYWGSYNLLKRKMTKNQEKLFQLISLLINSLSFKSAVSQIRQILKASPKLSNSINLLQNVVNLLTFFKYKHESRKSIMNVFEQIIKSPQFNSQIGDKIIFYINLEETQKKTLAIESRSEFLPMSTQNQIRMNKNNIIQIAETEKNTQTIRVFNTLKNQNEGLKINEKVKSSLKNEESKIEQIKNVQMQNLQTIHEKPQQKIKNN